MIGHRLKLARQRLGWSLRDLEKEIVNIVSAQAIGKYERDEMMPSSRVLIALADALKVSEGYLLRQGDLKLEGVEFRKNRITSKREEASVRADVLSAVERYLEIEGLVGTASAKWRLPPVAPFPVRSLEEAESAAVRLRGLWDLGIEAIPNLAELLEEKGIKVIALPLEDSVSGLMCHVRRSDGAPVPVIIVNKNDTGERQRLTIAHELGHLVLDVEEKIDEEKASFRFGSAFLMPAEVFWAEVGHQRKSVSLGELLQLKRIFRVSIQAIAYRCKDLGILGATAFRQMFGLFTRIGMRTPPYPEPEPLPPEEPQRFKRLCFRALAEGLISEGKAAELLEISVRQLTREMEELPTE